MNRRDLLKFSAAASSLTMFGNMSWANSPTTNKKLIWVILRGAQDGLSTLIPHNDPLLEEYRPTLWPQLKPNIIPLTSEFSLHPNLSFFKELFEQKQLIAIPAVSTGYKGRSHFQGQDYMECGLPEINHETGWVGRLLNVLNQKGIAISPMQPFCMRGSTLSTNWYPSSLNELDQSQYDSVLDLLYSDSKIQHNLKQALKTRDIIDDTNINTKSNTFEKLCESCGAIMNDGNEYPIATLELDGWDTHREQHKKLINQMRILNSGIETLYKNLDKKGSQFTIIISTEFGRTVKENGTSGTDHGGASSMFVIGKVGNREIYPDITNTQIDLSKQVENGLKEKFYMFDILKLMLKKELKLSSNQIKRIFLE